MIRAVVFDLWNTLVHSRHGDPFQHLRALMTPAQQTHYPLLKQDAMAMVHADATALLQRWRHCLELTDLQFAQMSQVFQDAADDAVTFPEALAALEEVRHCARVGLLSNTQSFDMDFLDRLGITERIPARFLSAHTGFLKPSPDAFRSVQRQFGLFPGQMAMVGDSWNDDVQGALAAGWTAIWVNREGRPRPDVDPEADFLEVTDLSQVSQAVLALQAGARCSTCLG